VRRCALPRGGRTARRFGLHALSFCPLNGREDPGGGVDWPGAAGVSAPYGASRGSEWVGESGVDGSRDSVQRRNTVATILIVDDDAFVRAVLRDVLEGRGHALLEAGDGREALDVLGERSPQLVLLDLFMPRLSGMEALALMRERWPSARVLVISSLESERLVAEALEAGAAGYITKPFHPMEITSAVDRALAN
jgi:two-component system, chemotaxis family, chemotaxis protein CheY